MSRAGAIWPGFLLLTAGIGAFYFLTSIPDTDDAFFLNMAAGAKLGLQRPVDEAQRGGEIGARRRQGQAEAEEVRGPEGAAREAQGLGARQALGDPDRLVLGESVSGAQGLGELAVDTVFENARAGVGVVDRPLDSQPDRRERDREKGEENNAADQVIHHTVSGKPKGGTAKL